MELGWRLVSKGNKSMRTQEARIRLTPPVMPDLRPFEVPTLKVAQDTAFVANDIEDGIEYLTSETASGVTLNTYRRFPSPLVKLHKRAGLPSASFLAGIEYGKLYRKAWGSVSPPFSDPTRIIVQGGVRSFEPKEGYRPAINELNELERILFGLETRNLLDAVCGLEMSLRGYSLRAQIDRAAAKKRLFAALAKYADYRKARK